MIEVISPWPRGFSKATDRSSSSYQQTLPWRWDQLPHIIMMKPLPNPGVFYTMRPWLVPNHNFSTIAIFILTLTSVVWSQFPPMLSPTLSQGEAFMRLRPNFTIWTESPTLFWTHPQYTHQPMAGRPVLPSSVYTNSTFDYLTSASMPINAHFVV